MLNNQLNFYIRISMGASGVRDAGLWTNRRCSWSTTGGCGGTATQEKGWQGVDDRWCDTANCWNFY